VEVMGTIYWEF